MLHCFVHLADLCLYVSYKSFIILLHKGSERKLCRLQKEDKCLPPFFGSFEVMESVFCLAAQKVHFSTVLELKQTMMMNFVVGTNALLNQVNSDVLVFVVEFKDLSQLAALIVDLSIR